MMTEGAVSIELSDDTAVGVGTLFDGFGSTAVTTNAGTGPVVPVSDAFGVAEGTPVWWTAVSVGSDVASAQMTFADGSTDQMAPIDGVVVLAHSIDPGVAAAGPGPYVVRGTLRLLDSSGAVLNTVSIPEVTATPAMPPVPVAVSPPLTMPASAIHAPVPALSSAAGADGGIAVCDDTAVPTPTPEAVAPSIAP
jgi:hypothetical protein